MPLLNLQGASRTEGGILRQKAVGNMFKPGDDTLSFRNLPSAEALKVYVRIFDSKPDNFQAEPSLVVEIFKVDTLGELLTEVITKNRPHLSGLLFFSSN